MRFRKTCALFIIIGSAIMLAACNGVSQIDISVSAHDIKWVSERGIFEIKRDALSAVIEPDKSDVDNKKGWMRPKTKKDVVFTLYLNPDYDHEELKLTVSGVLLTPLSIAPVQSDYFTGGKEIPESINTAVAARYRIEGMPLLGKVAIAFNLEKIKITQNCWSIDSIAKGTLVEKTYFDTLDFKTGFVEIKRGERAGKGILGEDFNIVIDLKKADKGRFIKFERGTAAQIVEFKLSEKDGKYTAEIEGETTEIKLEFGNLVLKRQNGDSFTVMRFTKTPKGNRA